MASYNDVHTVLLDTNILIYSAERPFDIEHQLMSAGYSDIRVPQVVLEELVRISRCGTKLSKFARLALEIAKRFKIAELESEGGRADSQLIHAAMTGNYIIATADAAIRRRLKLEGLPVIFLKDKRLTSQLG